MIIFLDNAESILDSEYAREIYPLVEELSQVKDVCLCLTSRISAVPPACKVLDIPTLSMEAAHDTFYHIYGGHGQSGPVKTILEQLDFHPLSITILATVAFQDGWDTATLARQWEGRRTDILRMHHEGGDLAATIELSLASPMFRRLGSDARGLLEVVAFFPHGVNENNLDWLFPSLANRTEILDTFCTLSLTHRSDGFVTMLAPFRDHLRPKDPASSPLLQATKDCYFDRLSVDLNPDEPSFEKAQWIRSEDVNVEHLLVTFTSIDGGVARGADAIRVWGTCAYFLEHLYWHKPRLVVLGPAIEGLQDDHPSKLRCLLELSRLFGMVGNHTEYKRLLTHVLGLSRERGDDLQVAETLRAISNANRLLGLHEEGIRQAKEALKIYERLNNISGQAYSWQRLAWLYYDNKQLGAAEEAASQVINLLSGGGEQFPVCECHRVLGKLYHSQGKTEKAIEHFDAALKIASAFEWDYQLFWNHYSLAEVYLDEDEFDDAHVHVERAKSHANNDPSQLGRAMRLQARFWYKRGMLEEAKSEALSAVDLFKMLGATAELEFCMVILRNIEEAQ